MDLLTNFRSHVINSVSNCIVPVQNNEITEETIITLEEILELVVASRVLLPSLRGSTVVKLEEAIYLMINMIDDPIPPRRQPGRPGLNIPVSTIENFLAMNFKAVDIAKLMGVSRETIFRRMRENQLSVRDGYTVISDVDLNRAVQTILSQFPNTGYKRMKGFLLHERIKVTDKRVRQAMRDVDPEGVRIRTLFNRAIVRRQYYVAYFKELWHLDTNMKLIRWNIVIRSCIDGKSRMVVYLDASADNTAQSNFLSFLNAVHQYGVPSRTRSDKGGENVLIARYMIEKRGTDRASHICGRSVHNQRIERYWRDVFYGYTSTMYNVFCAMEADGNLDIDNPKHLTVLHKVFVPRINHFLEYFRNGWNLHPLSSEGNYSPCQLKEMYRPPSEMELALTPMEEEDVRFICDHIGDADILADETQDGITNPVHHSNCLSAQELYDISMIDVLRESSVFGYDIFLEALSCIN